MTEAPALAGLHAPNWSSGMPDSPLARLSLDVWRWQTATPLPDGPELCAADKQSAASLPPSRRAGFLSRRIVLRRILARYLGCEPEQVVIGKTTRGRPFIEHPRTTLDFNLSDSKGTVLLALAGEGQIGVDIEYHRPLEDPLGIARRVLPEAWIRELAIVDGHERIRRFFSLWTRFEACQKARGQGVFATPAAPQKQCFSGFLAAPGCSAHVCIAGVDTMPERKSWRFLDYAYHD